MLKIIFENGEVFKSENIYDSKWNEMPDYPIKSIEYKITGHTRSVILSGYDSYNHIVEHFTVMNNMMAGVSKIVLMAKKDNKVNRIIFDFLKRYVKEDVVEYGKEYNEKSVTGWKNGMVGQTPKKEII